MVTRSIETDYLVIGAGAMGMAFTDALIDNADVHVTLVDRCHAAGGHWRDAYPFVQLHQASLFYGVASTELGTGAIQSEGPEAGLHERARQPEIQAYYDDILHRRFLGSGHVTFLGGYDHHEESGHQLVTSLVSGETVQVNVRRRVVDATYLSPTIPATTPPPFDVADDVRVVPVNELARLTAAPSDFIIVGSGKTATDGIIWLLAHGVPPDRIVWVRPRDPWMLDRAVVQPDPVVMLGLAADTLASAITARSPNEMFLRLEAAGVMLRIDRDVVPTMAKTPTLGRWELELLRTIERVVRLGHIGYVNRREIVFDKGSIPLAPRSLVIHCAASGLSYPPLIPIWEPDKIRLQTNPGRLPVLLCGTGWLRGGHPRRRPGTQPAVSAEQAPRQPDQLGRDADARHLGGTRVWRRAGHRRVGEPVCTEPGAPRPVTGRRPCCDVRLRSSGRGLRTRTRTYGQASRHVAPRRRELNAPVARIHSDDDAC